MMIPTTLGLLVCALILHSADGACPGEQPTKHLLCYLEEISPKFDPCLCTHLILQAPLEKLSPQSELVQSGRRLQETNPSLRLVLRVTEAAEVALKRRGGYAQTVSGVVSKLELDGVELDLTWGKQIAGKVQLVDFIQTLSKELDKIETPTKRQKRSYKIREDILDDVVTPRWTLQANRKNKSRKTRDAETTEDKEEAETTTVKVTEESTPQGLTEDEDQDESPSNGKEILLHLTAEPQHLAKNYDLKRLSKYVSLYTLASDNLTDSSEHGLAYHPSRLMGIEDILNADSLVDLVTGLGAPHDKLVLTLPATALRFTLADKDKNMPQSPTTGEPSKISRSEVCTLMKEGQWTVERDEDLTAPYSYQDSTWLAFDDPTSVSIKGKYILLRDLAGAAVRDADAEDWNSKCEGSGLLQTLHDTFTTIARQPRAAQLVSLQEQLHEAGQFAYSGDVHLSPYRIVRVVDRAGAIHVVRKEAKTEFECSRQGYFRHPSGCNRFYRCVKFNQYTPDFTVFEYDCPAGLAFDETVEVCVWPGSLADGGACQGSSEIAPVPRTRYVCPAVAGYYADPENCRWFFACLDHQGDGSPLTAYEFRCPFGLVFDEQALVCNWPWLVPGCGGAGVYRARFTVGDFYEGRHRPSYASLSDVHVSGGRIENVPGGVVLGSAISGIGSGAYLGSHASGSNLLGAGAYSGGAGSYSGAAGAYTGGAGSYSGAVGAYSGGAGGAYVSGGSGEYVSGLGAGSLASGSYQSNTVSGSAAGYSGNAGSGTAYSAGTGAAYSAERAGSYSSGGAGYNAGSGYVDGSGATYGASGLGSGVTFVSGSGAGYKAGSGSSYSSGIGAGYNAGAAYNAGRGKYSATYSGAAGEVGGSSTRYGSAGSYGSSAYATGNYAGAYVDDNSGAYVEDNSGAYFHDSTGDTGGLYSGQESYGGRYSGGYSTGGAYIHGQYDNGAYKGSSSLGGQYKGDYVGGGAYTGLYDRGAYRGSGSTGGQYSGKYDAGSYSGTHDAGAYTGKYDGGAYSGKYDGGEYSGKYDAGAYSGKYDGGAYSGKYDGGAYSGKYDGGAYSGKYDGGAYSGKYDGGEYSGGAYSGGSDSGAYRGEQYYSGSKSYQGGYKVQSVPTVVGVDGYNTLNTVEHRPAVGLVGLDAVKVSGGDVHSGGYVSSFVTSSPLPAVSVTPVAPVVSGYSTVTPAPISGSTYKVQPTTPRPVTYYPVPSSLVTPVTSKPLLAYSTVIPPAYVEAYEQPSYVKTVTPAPAVVWYSTPTVGVVKTPVVPLNPVTYTYKQPLVHLSTPAPVTYERPSYLKTVTPAPYYEKDSIDYSYHNSLPSAYQPPLPSYSYEYNPPTSYVKPVEVKYSYPKPAVLKTPIVPLNPIQYSTPAPVQYPVQPIRPVSYATPSPLPAIPTVLKTPIVPLNPVQYSTPTPIHFEYSTPSPVKTASYSSYSTPASPTYQSVPLKPLRPITYTTPAPPVSYEYSTPRPIQQVKPLRPIAYSTPAPVSVEYHVPTDIKTPVVPLNPVQYSTPRPVSYSTPAQPVSFEYSTPRPIQQVSYVKPVTYSTPAPAVSYEYSAPSVRPVPLVSKTPVVPLNPIQYTTPAPAVHYEYSGPSVKPVTYTTPAPVHFQYSTPSPAPARPLRPVSYTTPAPPIVHEGYDYPKPAVKFVETSHVVSTTVQPLRPYSAPEYLPPAPVPVKPLRPVVYSTPAPPVSYEYSSVIKPVVPAVLKSPVVPLNPIQYTTPAPVHFEYSTSSPAPVRPYRPVTYTTPAPAVTYDYQPVAPVQPLKPLRPAPSYVPSAPAYNPPAPQPSLRPITYTTPAPALKPVVPAVLRTPVVPLNPIQYTTPAPAVFQYSTPSPAPLKPITYTTPAPAVHYEYNHPEPVQPVRPLRPVSYSSEYLPPAPVQPIRPLRPITYTTPAPTVTYQYSPALKPVVPAVFKTPVVPLNPIQYTTPAPAVFQYSTPSTAPLKPITYTTPAPAIHYEYNHPEPVQPLRPVSYSAPEYLPPAQVQPVRPLRPITYTTPAPPLKPVVPAVLRTPVVPLNPIQYTTPAPAVFQYSTPSPAPLKPITYTTPAPAIHYEYNHPEPIQPVKPLRPVSYSAPEYLPPAPVQPVRPLRPITYTTPAPTVTYQYTPAVKPIVPAVFKTPVVPLNPIQYTTPAPAVYQYSTPAPVPLKPLKPVTYEYLPPAPVQPVRPITLSTPAPFSYDFKYQSEKVVPTVLKTPIVPLNPVQYTTPAPAVYRYSTPAPVRPVTYTTSSPAVNYEYSTPVPPTPSYIKPVPTVLKTPVVPLNPVQYTTPAPVINQYTFGVAYEHPEIQYEPELHHRQQTFTKTKVEQGYTYNQPTVKFVSTTPAPPVRYTPEEPVTPLYKQVYNYVKEPMVTAYEKVLNAISYSTTPAPLPVQPVTQSPVSYAPVNVGPSYGRPALVKTASIPVTPVTVVPEYQKVLNVVKATTTSEPLYVNHYTSTYEPEVVPVSTPRPGLYKKKPVVYTQTADVSDYSYEENVDAVYDSIKSDFGTRLTSGYGEGYVYNQQKVEVPQINVYTSTTAAPVVQETYRVRKPVKTYSQTYVQPAVNVQYEGGAVYSSTPAPALVSSSEASFGEQYHRETSFTGYTGHEGDVVSYEEHEPVLPVVTSTTQAPTVKITTARVSLPVVSTTTDGPEGGYYVRRQKVRVRPVVTTSENYPEVYSSTYTPSTVSTTTFTPTYSYSTTPAPIVKVSTTLHPDDVVDVEGEEEESDAKLLEEFNGQYGGIVSKEGYSVSSTVSSIEDGEAIVGVLKKGRVTYDGRRTKTKVVVVSKLSDFNPLLVGKLGAECSCDGRSNAVTIRRSKQRGSNKLFTPSSDSTVPDQQLVDTYLTSTSTAAPIIVGSKSSYESSGYESSSSYESSSYNSPVVEIKPLRKKVRYYSTTTTGAPEYSEEVLVSEGPNVLPAGSSRVKADSIECKRAGLFRHPNKCNKFYSCNWDQWKKKFTLHEFKCPIHLAYDINLGACNWPSKGPACADDNLLV